MILLALYLLGYTRFLGGPYGLARFLFLILLIGAFVFFVIIYFLWSFFRRKITPKTEDEKIKVDVTIIE